MARLEGPATSWTSDETTSKSRRARVDLADAGEDAVEAEVVGHALLELLQLGGVAVEQVEHVLGGAHRALDAAQRVAGQQALDPVEPDQHLVGDGREPLAERGRLRGDVVGAAGHHGGLVLGGQAAQPGQGGDGPVADQRERLLDLELLDVLGQVARGHALVDVLVPGRAENSSIRAFTSCRVTRSRAAIDSRSTFSVTSR